MKRILAVFLAFIMVFSLCACKKSQNNSENNSVSGSENNSVTGSQNNSVTGSENNSEHYSQNTNKEQSQSNVSNGVVTENVKIDTLDKLNFYAVKNAIAQNETVLLTGLNDRPTVQTLESKVDYNILNLTGSTSANIDANSTFTITMYSYFTITLNDPKGFLAQKLGGTGNVEVVITTNNFNNMITFKKGERYYSCLQTSSTKKAMSFSTYKYVNGFKLVENYAGENYQFTVYFEGDKVIGMNSGRFNSDSNNFNYSPDDITLSNTFSFVVYKIQSFTAKQLEGLFTYNNSIISDGIGLNDGTVLYGQASLTDNAVAFKDSKGKTVLSNNDIKKVSAVRSSKFGYCVKLELNDNTKISDKTSLDFYLNNSRVSAVTLKKDGTSVYITDLYKKTEMSNIYYKLTAASTNGKIGRIIRPDSFNTEMSKRIDLNDYTLKKEDYSEAYGQNDIAVCCEYTLNKNKTLSYKASNYNFVIDDIAITLPIKVSDLRGKGFKIVEEVFSYSSMTGGLDIITSNGNKADCFVMDFYGGAKTFEDCYVTQIQFICYEGTIRYQEGISPTCPNFEMFEGINKNSTIDDVVSILGEPSEIHYDYFYSDISDNEEATIQLVYDFPTPDIPNGDVWFTFHPVKNIYTPTDFLDAISYSLQ